MFRHSLPHSRIGWKSHGAGLAADPLFAIWTALLSDRRYSSECVTIELEIYAGLELEPPVSNFVVEDAEGTALCRFKSGVPPVAAKNPPLIAGVG